MEKKYASREAYISFYNSKENMWRPAVLKTDLPDAYRRAIKVQATIEGDDSTISSLIARYIKEGLARDGRIKEAV